MASKLVFGKSTTKTAMNSTSGIGRSGSAPGARMGRIAVPRAGAHAPGMVEWLSGCIKIRGIRWAAPASTNR